MDRPFRSRAPLSNRSSLFGANEKLRMSSASYQPLALEAGEDEEVSGRCTSVVCKTRVAGAAAARWHEPPALVMPNLNFCFHRVARSNSRSVLVFGLACTIHGTIPVRQPRRALNLLICFLNQQLRFWYDQPAI